MKNVLVDPQKDLAELIAELIAELNAASDEYAKAADSQREADSRKIRALNRLNEAQQAIDRHVNALRKSAPRDTDWQRAERERAARPA